MGMKYIKFLVVLLVTFGLTTLSAETKRYEVKSGIVAYAITHSGDMMGMKMHGSGTAKTAFKEWGNVELHSEESQTVTMGMKQQNNQMTKIENGMVYTVDFDQKVIYELRMDTLVNAKDKDLIKTGKETLISMGGKKIGDEKFMGYACEVWEMMKVKVWIHKGVMLKSEADMMGIKVTTVATKVEFDVSVPDDALKLIDYPIQKGQKQQQMNEMPQMTPEQIQQMQEMMKSFSQR